ncbi:MAG: carboxypeptidase regulatory-like domain-containing protein [Pyrinomonadaceae bacterium]
MGKLPLGLIALFFLFNTFVICQDKGHAILNGRVTTLLGVPLDGVVIDISPVNGKATNTRTDSLGGYRFENLPYGYATVSYRLTGFYKETINVYINRKSVTRDIGMRVGDLGPLDKIQVKGVIRDSSGFPTNGATVSIFNIFNQEVKETTQTDSSGRYLLETDREGDYVIVVLKPSFQAEAQLVRLRSVRDTTKQYEIDLWIKRTSDP